MVNLPSNPKPFFSADKSKPTIVSPEKQAKIIKAAIKVIKRNEQLLDELKTQKYEAISQQ